MGQSSDMNLVVSQYSDIFPTTPVEYLITSLLAVKMWMEVWFRSPMVLLGWSVSAWRIDDSSQFVVTGNSQSSQMPWKSDTVALVGYMTTTVVQFWRGFVYQICHLYVNFGCSGSVVPSSTGSCKEEYTLQTGEGDNIGTSYVYRHVF